LKLWVVVSLQRMTPLDVQASMTDQGWIRSKARAPELPRPRSGGVLGLVTAASTHRNPPAGLCMARAPATKRTRAKLIGAGVLHVPEPLTGLGARARWLVVGRLQGRIRTVQWGPPTGGTCTCSPSHRQPRRLRIARKSSDAHAHLIWRLLCILAPFWILCHRIMPSPVAVPPTI
jgi:hypothetical protein